MTQEEKAATLDAIIDAIERSSELGVHHVSMGAWPIYRNDPAGVEILRAIHARARETKEAAPVYRGAEAVTFLKALNQACEEAER